MCLVPKLHALLWVLFVEYFIERINKVVFCIINDMKCTVVCGHCGIIYRYFPFHINLHFIQCSFSSVVHVLWVEVLILKFSAMKLI